MAPPPRKSKKTTKSPTPFVFRRSKVKFETQTTTKEVRLDKTKFSSKEALEEALHGNIPISTSGRTLGIALSLSHPEDLASYSIDAVRDSVWKKVEVTYSRPGPNQDLVERVKCLEKEVKRMTDVLDTKLVKEEVSEKTMMLWQTAQSVFNAYGIFAWALLPESARSNLANFGISDFTKLFYTHSSKGDPTPAKTAAKNAIALLPANIKQYSFAILAMKNGVSEERHKHAHPTISENSLEDFLDAIGLKEDYLEPSLELQLLRHLRATARDWKPSYE